MADDNKYSGAFNDKQGKGINSRRALAIAQLEAQNYSYGGKKKRRGMGRIARYFIFLIISLVGFSWSLPTVVKKALWAKDRMLRSMTSPANLEKMLLTQPTDATRVVTETALPEEELNAVAVPPPSDDGEINIVAKGDGEKIIYMSAGAGGGVGQCQIHLESSPPGARVKVNGIQFAGTTPVNVRGECDKPLKLDFDLDNYLPASRTLALNQKTGDYSVRLHAIPKPKAKKPGTSPMESVQKSLMNMLGGGLDE